MIGLIQILVIWGMIVYIINKKKKSGQNPGRGQAPNTTVNTAGTNNQNHGRLPHGQGPRDGHWGQNISLPHGKTGMQGASGSQNVNPQRPPVPASAAQAKAVTRMPATDAEEDSTTAYLAKKAEEDAREHAKEKWEEEKRLRETKGGFAVAGRHLDGDPIPQGSRCVVCGYCAAENLVPMIPKTRYSCYFCREPLN